MPAVLSRIGGAEARVWVHVIHFPFAGRGNDERTWNEEDLKNLKSTFGAYSNCTFKHRESQSRDEIFKSLQSEGMKKLFEDDNVSGPPDVYILIVLSHGKENGVIFTDTSNEEFTTTQVTQKLGNNAFLENASKAIFFGPCKGSDVEQRLPVVGQKQPVSPSSTRILAEPNKKNFAIFYSTLESMAALTLSNGSQMVLALCMTLNTLEKDVDVLELFRLVTNKVCAYYVSKGTCQMPQCYVLPHDHEITFCKRSLRIGSDAKGNMAPVGVRREFYPWQSEKGEKYNRGLALVFGASKEEETKLRAPFDALKYQNEFKPLSDIELTLEKVSSNVMVQRMGSLFVVVVARLSISDYSGDQQEWLIDVGKAQFPIANLLNKFVGTKCPAFATKTKMFFFVDPGLGDEAVSHGVIPTTHDVPAGMNHENFLVMTLHGNDAMEKLFEVLDQTLKEKISSLQCALKPILNSGSKENKVSLIWSTMTKLIDFSNDVDTYSPHHLDVRDDEGLTTLHQHYSFEKFVEQQAATCHKGTARAVRVYGLGQTRFAEELHSRLVVEVNADVVLVKLDDDKDFWQRSGATTTDILKKFANKEIPSPPWKRLIFIVDGWSNLKGNQKQNALKFLKSLADSTQVQLLVTMDWQDRDKLKIDWSESYALDISKCSDEIQSLLRLKNDDKEKNRRDEARKARENGDFSDEFFFPQSMSVMSKSVKRRMLADADKCANMIAKSSAGSAFVISCGPGMGKTTNLRQIEMALQRKFSEFMTIRLNLHDCYGELHKLKSIEEKGFDSYWNFIKEVTKSRLQREKVRDRKVIVLLDSVDEVCPTLRTVTLQLLKHLKQMEMKVLVATRPQEEKVVVDALEGCTVLKLHLIADKDRPTFIAGVCKDQSHLDRATKLLDSERFDWWKLGFWSIPLNLVMLVELSREEKIDGETLRADNLHRLMIKKCIKDTVEHFNPKDPDSDETEDKEKRYERVRELAVEYILGSGKIKASGDDRKQKLHRYALFIFNDGTNELQFTHRTYAEYLVADRFVTMIIDGKKDKRFEGELKKFVESEWFLQFIDSLLVNVHSKCSLPPEMKSERFFYICIENEYLNIFKMLHKNFAFDISLFNMKIEKSETEKKFPLEILITKGRFDHRCKNEDFARYLEVNNAGLESFINEGNRGDMLDNAIRAHLNSLVKNHWDTFFQPSLVKSQFDCSLQRLRDRKSLFSLLKMALEKTNEELAIFFIEKGADMELALRTAISFDCSKGMVEFIVKKANVKIESEDLSTATKDVKFLQILLPQVSSDFGKEYMADALKEAVRENRHAAVQYLLENGAEPNKEDEDGYTSLDLASKVGSMACFDLLYDVTENKDLNRLLLNAAKGGSVKIFERLLRDGADLKAVDAQGNTCLHRAAMSWKSSNCLEFLLENLLDDFDIETRNKKGQTPLMVATKSGWESERGIALLLAKDANPAARDNDGFTPLHYAAQNCRIDDCKMLLAKVENVDEVINSRTNDDDKTPLILAASRCDNDAVAVIELLLANDADIKKTDYTLKNCLHFAAKSGNIRSVKFILEKNEIGIDDKCEEGLTPLIFAARKNAVDVIEILVAKGANFKVTDGEGKNFLHLAAESNNPESAKYFLEQGLPVNSTCKNGWTPLMLAAHKNAVDVMEVLVENGANFQVIDDGGENFLHLAAKKRHLESVKFFLEKGTPVDDKCEGGFTPLMFAARLDAVDVMEILVAKGANFKVISDDGKNFLHLAAKNGHRKSVKFFLERGIPVDDKCNGGLTPLMLVSKKWEENVELTLAQLTDLECKTNYGKNPLLLAAKSRSSDTVAVIELLLENGADIKVKDNNGKNCLHHAAENGDYDCVKFFLEYKILIDSTSKGGLTPLMLASKIPDWYGLNIIKLLLEKGADANLKDDEGWNCLHHSAAAASKIYVGLLIAHVTDLECKTNDGKTAMQLAEEKGFTWVVSLLKEHAAIKERKRHHEGASNESDEESDLKKFKVTKW